MKLRDHPKIRKWPLSWTGWGGPGVSLPMREEGVLKEVVIVDGFGPNPTYIRLSKTFKGGIYTAVFECEDLTLLQPLYINLKQCIGQSIDNVGNLEF